MKKIKLYTAIVFVVLLLSFGVTLAEDSAAKDSVEPTLLDSILSLNALQANWIFSGTVNNENNERYNYFFQLQRNNAQFHAIAALIDEKRKTVILYEESNTLIAQPEKTYWQVGNLFLRFNPINNSWVFGVKDKKKRGFNFKVDMLGQPTANNKPQVLRSGVELLLSQTGRLNGHIQTEDDQKEEFVTANKAWFEQLWVSNLQVINHPIMSVLCDFKDGSALYSVTLREKDALQGAAASFYDAEGLTIPMSQFVTIAQGKEGLWTIKVPSPKLNLSVFNLLNKINEKQQVTAGLTEGTKPGFCVISQDEIT